MAAAVDESEFHVLTRDRVLEELGAVGGGKADLQVRRPLPAQRYRPEHGPAEVRATASAPGDDTRGRPLKRREARREDTGLVQHLERMIHSGNVQLVARRPVKGVLRVRADLALDL